MHNHDEYDGNETHPSEVLLNQAVSIMEGDAVDFFDKLRYVADNCEVDADELLYALRQCS